MVPQSQLWSLLFLPILVVLRGYDYHHLPFVLVCALVITVLTIRILLVSVLQVGDHPSGAGTHFRLDLGSATRPTVANWWVRGRWWQTASADALAVSAP